MNLLTNLMNVQGHLRDKAWEAFFFLVEGTDAKKVQDYVIHHIADSDIWAPLPFVKGIVLRSFEVFGYTYGKGLHALMLVIASFICLLLFGVLYKKVPLKAPKGLTNMLEAMVLFVRNDICYTYLGKKDGERLAPFILTMFFLILTANLMGLIPLFSTATANLGVTLGLASVTFLVMIAGGVVTNGPIGFFKCFVPSGVPKVFLPMLFILEFMGLFVKPFALTIRLFANMLAGHMVIFFLIGLIMILGAAALPTLLLALFIYALEILVAFIQAYVFTLLTAMFIASMMHPEH